jgi:hypothetical protein
MKYQTTEYNIQRRIVIDLRIYMYLLQYMIYTDVIDLSVALYDLHRRCRFTYIHVFVAVYDL